MHVTLKHPYKNRDYCRTSCTLIRFDTQRTYDSIPANATSEPSHVYIAAAVKLKCLCARRCRQKIKMSQFQSNVGSEAVHLTTNPLSYRVWRCGASNPCEVWLQCDMSPCSDILDKSSEGSSDGSGGRCRCSGHSDTMASCGSPDDDTEQGGT